MSGRRLKMLLAASVALNIFAGAAGAALWISNQRVSNHVSEASKAGQRKPLNLLVADLGEPQSGRVMAVLRAKAIEAQPDFEQARSARREAIRLTESEQFRPVEVAALLEQSRAAEMRGRGRLEASAVDVLASLSAQERRKLAPMLSRKVQRGGSSAPKDHQKDQPPAAAEASQG
jgi:uncharacterized membrane protein